MKTKITFYFVLLLALAPLYLVAQTPDTTHRQNTQQINESEQRTAQYQLEDENEWTSGISDDERRNMDKQMIKELKKSERKLEAELKRVDKQIVKLKHEQLRLEQDRINIKNDQKRIQDEIRKL